ncbi:MAG TPA: PEP/pyruvate-binding domain-containing protein, partial [Acidimicrobiia bacterium]|nr:PEP/pyruvate-binding domain-containing protein [Acidimicrobiia bacterium]
MTAPTSDNIRWFGELGIEDVALVGGKNASLGELHRTLTPLGIRVPNGFAVTAGAYRETLALSGATEELRRLMSGVDKSNIEDLARRARRAREIVYEAPLSERLQNDIVNDYQRLVEEYGPDVSMAVRSSATAEDLPTAS